MDQLLTEARNPASINLDELTPLQLVQLMNAEDSRVAPAVAVQAEKIAEAIEIIADRLRAGGRLIYAGAGTSGRLGILDATECPPTFNSPPGQVTGIIAGGPPAITQAVEGAEDHPEFAKRDLEALPLSARDVVVGIATSGRTPYVLGAVSYARQRGIYTVGLSCNPDSELSGQVDLAITVAVGPEILSGSTRLKAGTATKLVLNMLTTGAMVRLGKTYGNLMVDLRATNTKLRARTNRILRILTDLNQEEADALLQRCRGELKTALVVQLGHLEPDEARTRVISAQGRVRAALASIAKPAISAADDDLFLGIDGGGSHTVALLARKAANGPGWSVLGRGQAGPSNVHAVGQARALAALDQAVSATFAATGLARSTVNAAGLGLAGVDRPEDCQRILDWAGRVKLARAVEVVNDAVLLLAAGTPEGWGVAIVAGTGSIAFGRAPDGRTTRAGGWGYLLGDEGSGYLIVLQALQAVARSADGREPPTSLTDRLLTRLGLTQPQELIPTVYGGSWDRAALASLAPLVFEEAKHDAVARTIVERNAMDLARMAAVVVRQLGLDDKPWPFALTGGVVLENEDFRQRVLQALREQGVPPSTVTPVREPAEGGLRLALGAIREVTPK